MSGYGSLTAHTSRFAADGVAFGTLTLRQRLLLAVLVPAALLAVGVAWLFLLHNARALEEALRERGLAIVRFLAPAAEWGLASSSQQVLLPLLQAAMAQRGVTAVIVYDADGFVVSRVGVPTLTPDLRAAVADGGVLGRGTERMAFFAQVLAAPLRADGAGAPAGGETATPLGWVHVELETQTVQANRRAGAVQALLAVVLGLTVTAALAARLARSVTAPLSRLGAAVSQMAAGRYDTYVPSSCAMAELRELEQGFNSMAQAIARAQNTLQAHVEEATARLAFQAFRDPLTELPNRRAFEQALEASVASSRHAGERDVLCYLDLDRFKRVNDSCGHAAGDELLRRVAVVLRHEVRDDDLVCRIGGDEFALILYACEPQEARRIADELCRSIGAIRFEWNGQSFDIGASIGLARIDGARRSAADILVAADMACYAAKRGAACGRSGRSA